MNIDINIYINIDNKMTRAGDIYVYALDYAFSSGLDYTSNRDIIARMTKNKLVKTHKKFNFIFKQAYNKLRSNKLNCAQTQTQTQTFKQAYDKLRSNKLNCAQTQTQTQTFKQAYDKLRSNKLNKSKLKK